MKGIISYCLSNIWLLILTCSINSLAGQESTRIIIGQKASLYSKILNKKIQLSIHLPNDYYISNEKYPVLYTFQTHFEMVAGAVKDLYDYSMIPKMIVVRVDNYEFGYLTPTIVEENPNSGKAELFLRFFEKELFPFIDTNFMVHPYRILFSNSWGAMFASYSILAHPNIFNAGIGLMKIICRLHIGLYSQD